MVSHLFHFEVEVYALSRCDHLRPARRSSSMTRLSSSMTCPRSAWCACPSSPYMRLLTATAFRRRPSLSCLRFRGIGSAHHLAQRVDEPVIRDSLLELSP